MIKIIDDTEEYTVIRFTENAIIRWDGKGKSYPFYSSLLYIFCPERQAWNSYGIRWADVRAIKPANQRRILNHLLEEERKRLCHPSL